MHVEPVEIQHVKLRRRLLGYEPEAVDRLLENVTASYEDVWFERGQLEAELASMRNKLDGQAQAKAALQGSVLVAQSTADELLADARVKAQALIDDAHRQSSTVLRDAELEQQRLRVEVKKLEVAETEITLRLRALLTAARELLDGHEGIRALAAQEAGQDSTPPADGMPSPEAGNGAVRGSSAPPEADLETQVTIVAEQPEATRTAPVHAPSASPAPPPRPPEAPAPAPSTTAEDAPASQVEPPVAGAVVAAAAVTAALSSSRESAPPPAPPPAPTPAPPAAVETAPVTPPAPAPATAPIPAPRPADADEGRVGPDPAVANRARV